MHECLIAFGSNLGDGEAIFQQSLKYLASFNQVLVKKASDLVLTRPVGGPTGQARFLNAAILVQTKLNVEAFHQRTSQIENRLGRDRRVRWGARKVDLDLLLFDNCQLQSKTLTLPHPRMSFRRFVLEPAAQIAGEMINPVCGMTVAQLLNHLDQKPNEIVWLTDHHPQVTQCLEKIAALDLAETWLIHVVTALEQFEKRKANAKLVLLSSRSTFEPSLDQYRGPRLRLPDTCPGWELEIKAAMQAMTPITGTR